MTYFEFLQILITKFWHIWLMLGAATFGAYFVEHNETAERLLFKAAAKLGLQTDSEIE